MDKKAKSLLVNAAFALAGGVTIFLLRGYIVERQTEQLLSAAEQSAERIHQDALKRERELSEIRLNELREKQRIENEQVAQVNAQRTVCDAFDRQWKLVPEATNYCENLPTEKALIECKNRYIRARAAFWQQNPDSKSCPQIWGMTSAP